MLGEASARLVLEFGQIKLDFCKLVQDFAVFFGELLIGPTSRPETWYENIYELLSSLGAHSAMPVLEFRRRILDFREIFVNSCKIL